MICPFDTLRSHFYLIPRKLVKSLYMSNCESTSILSVDHYGHFRKQNVLHQRRQNEETPTTVIEQEQQQQMQIFLNQSNNIFILAKHGQTVSLPCIIYRQNNQDLNNVQLAMFTLITICVLLLLILSSSRFSVVYLSHKPSI